MATAPATKRLPNIKGWVYDDEDSYCRVEDEEAREMVTDAYVPTATYTKGETCIQDNKLYRAKADIATAEIWTPDHWEETSLEQIRKEMAAELSALNAKSKVSFFNSQAEDIVTPSAGLVVLNTQKAYLNKGTYLVSVFGTIGSTAGTATLTLAFDGGERGYAQNTQNTHDGCCQVVLYEVKESKEYTFTFSLGCNVGIGTLYGYLRYGYTVVQIS